MLAALAALAALAGGAGPCCPAERVAGPRLAYLMTLPLTGAGPAAPSGGGGGGGYSPSLDFSDARNSQYLGPFHF